MLVHFNRPPQIRLLVPQAERKRWCWHSQRSLLRLLLRGLLLWKLLLGLLNDLLLLSLLQVLYCNVAQLLSILF